MSWRQLRSELKSDMRSLRADVASDLLTTRKELGEQIVGLRRAVIEYHTSVIGRGVLVSELEARVRRVEQHLNLPSLYRRNLNAAMYVALFAAAWAAARRFSTILTAITDPS